MSVARIRVRLAPVAWLVGVGFAGVSFDGLRGAGIALMLPATVVFVAALIDEHLGSGVGGRQRTLRHRWLLRLDRFERRLERWERERRERKEAERRFLDSRRARKGR